MRKKISALLFAMIVWSLAALPVRAAGGVHLGFSDPTANVGEEVTVVVMATKEGTEEAVPLSSVEMELSYDATLLKFEGSAGGMGNLFVGGDAGTLRLTDSPSGDSSAFLAELHFTAMAAGNSELKVLSASVKDAAGGEPSCSFGTSSVCVNVKTEQDVSLYSLSFNVGQLTPAFEPERTLYHLTVPMETTYVTVAARPNNYWATHYVDGHGSLQPGENTVTITVTSGDRSAQRVYTVIVYRGTPPVSTTAPVEVPTATVPPEDSTMFSGELSVGGEKKENSVPEAELPAEESTEESATETETPEPETAEPENAGEEKTPEKTEGEMNADTAALVEAAYNRGKTEKEVEAALARTALQNTEERVSTLEHAAKITTVAAMAELVIIVILGYLLWNSKRTGGNEEEWEEFEK